MEKLMNGLVLRGTKSVPEKNMNGSLVYDKNLGACHYSKKYKVVNFYLLVIPGPSLLGKEKILQIFLIFFLCGVIRACHY
jgi:hypothetical protein